MNLMEYLDKDFQLLRKHIIDVSNAYDKQDPGVTLEKAKIMFESFSRRFAIEDLLLSKMTPTKEMSGFVRELLQKRKLLREELEGMLMMHVSEPDFESEIKNLIKQSESHVNYLEQEFHPNVIAKLPQSDLVKMSAALEEKLHVQS